MNIISIVGQPIFRAAGKCQLQCVNIAGRIAPAPSDHLRGTSNNLKFPHGHRRNSLIQRHQNFGETGFSRSPENSS